MWSQGGQSVGCLFYPLKIDMTQNVEGDHSNVSSEDIDKLYNRATVANKIKRGVSHEPNLTFNQPVHPRRRRNH